MKKKNEAKKKSYETNFKGSEINIIHYGRCVVVVAVFSPVPSSYTCYHLAWLST